MTEIKNPLKGATDYGWHFEQEVFLPSGIVRSVKAGGGARATYRRSSFAMAQRVGDRDKVDWSIKSVAFTIPANPMSDRMQLVIETYEADDDTQEGAKRG